MTRHVAVKLRCTVTCRRVPMRTPLRCLGSVERPCHSARLSLSLRWPVGARVGVAVAVRWCDAGRTTSTLMVRQGCPLRYSDHHEVGESHHPPCSQRGIAICKGVTVTVELQILLQGALWRRAVFVLDILDNVLNELHAVVVELDPPAVAR